MNQLHVVARHVSIHQCRCHCFRDVLSNDAQSYSGNQTRRPAARSRTASRERRNVSVYVISVPSSGRSGSLSHLTSLRTPAKTHEAGRWAQRRVPSLSPFCLASVAGRLRACAVFRISVDEDDVLPDGPRILPPILERNVHDDVRSKPRHRLSDQAPGRRVLALDRRPACVAPAAPLF
jgi:hypothetical protein